MNAARFCAHTGKEREKCDCPRCRGWRAQRDGRKAQRRAAKTVNRLTPNTPAASSSRQMAHEEHWRARLRLEVKQGRQVNAVVAKFLEAEAQSHVSKAIGDYRPFVFVAEAAGMTDQIWCMRKSDLENVIEALT